MNTQVSKIFRSIQVHFPFLQDYRFHLQRNLRSLSNKTHEKDFEALAQLPRTGNNLFLDIGSNRGEAVQSILMRRPDARIIGFEPNSHLIKKVRKIYENDPRVKFLNFGLGQEAGTFSLYIPFYNNYMFDGLASLKETNARGWLRNRLYGYEEKKLTIAKALCEVKKLDDLNLRPYFVKIDVQGFEYEVLLGAQKTIAESSPILLIETPGKRELEFLLANRYGAFVYNNSRLVRGQTGLNVYFIPDAMQAEILN